MVLTAGWKIHYRITQITQTKHCDIRYNNERWCILCSEGFKDMTSINNHKWLLGNRWVRLKAHEGGINFATDWTCTQGWGFWTSDKRLWAIYQLLTTPEMIKFLKYMGHPALQLHMRQFIYRFIPLSSAGKQSIFIWCITHKNPLMDPKWQTNISERKLNSERQ